MSKLIKILPVLFAIMLINFSVTGCAQKRYTQNIDCRSCHSSNKVAGARDFSQIYANAASHHSVGVKYPVGVKADPGFNLPNGQGADIAFFDRNGNGRPDRDEILLFGTTGAVTIECASCHKAHGNAPLPATAAVNHYLRVNNVGSALCITCHNQ